ncbi:DUF5684 domain-containing protein [Microbacterium sp. ASV81]|uniref:DUF5684 domain-containing protein n=1 Tax=Microbacterium capsulatum TaxID=3041921 RepID=A0ABU0XJF6_9MICO|nr:DUF5684 domain-containing protein [Microbacterium sp. ASV81]MDQ4215274.1 DUF5684 domain-containing protein [Microbacterium sp. ASV81]
MALPVGSALLPALAVGGAAGLALGVGLWIWYAAALAKLFPRIGGEGWKGWVPVLNEAEVLSRGGVPAWGAVFFFIPVVQLYGLYLKIVAAHRINGRFRHGGGFTLLAIVLPPLWATLLAAGQDPVAEAGTAVPGGPQTGGIRTRVVSPRAALARDASGYAIPAAVPAESALIDAVPGGSAPVTDGSARASDPRPAPAPAPAQPAPASAQPVPASAQPVPVAEAPRGERWVLVLDDGTRLPLTGSGIVLGRAPAGAAGDQTVRIPDATRTLSKTHARLDRDGSGWRLTDLNSTNGVRVFARDGGTTVPAPGVPAPVQGRILLGDVGMLIVLDGAG